MEIWHGCYRLPQSGILTNKLLKKCKAKHVYFELPHTPGFWKHVSRPVQFTLIMDNFGVKYVGDKNFECIINALISQQNWWLVLLHNTGMGLQQMHSQYFNARICPKTISKIQPRETQKPTTLPMGTSTNKIWQQITRYNEFGKTDLSRKFRSKKSMGAAAAEHAREPAWRADEPCSQKQSQRQRGRQAE